MNALCAEPSREESALYISVRWFAGKPDISRCCWRAYSELCVSQLYRFWRLYCRSLSMPRLNDFLQKRIIHHGKSRSSKLKLLDFIPLQKSVIAEYIQAAIAKEAMHRAETLQSQQSHRVVYGPKAFSRSPIHLFFCLKCVLHSIERLPLEAR